MALEIERRFLVPDPGRLPSLGAAVRIVQSFLSAKPVVRVRIESSGGAAAPQPSGATSAQAEQAAESFAPSMGGATTRLKASLTIKGLPQPATPTSTTAQPHVALSRLELEYPIPVAEARELERIAPWPAIVKDRFRVGRFEVDRFYAPFDGLWIAEIELSTVDEAVEIPDWCGQEITHVAGWSNAELAQSQKLPGR